MWSKGLEPNSVPRRISSSLARSITSRRRPNRSDISTFHCSSSGPAGETMRMRWTSRRAVSSVSTRPAWQVLPRPDAIGQQQPDAAHADRPEDRHKLVGLDAEAARLDGQEGVGAEGLLQEERLVVDEPVADRPGALRGEIAARWLDGLKRVEEFDLAVAERAVEPAQPVQRLSAQRLREDDFPAQPARLHFRSWQ